MFFPISGWAVASELLNVWPKSQAQSLATELLIKKMCTEAKRVIMCKVKGGGEGLRGNNNSPETLPGLPGLTRLTK